MATVIRLFVLTALLAGLQAVAHAASPNEWNAVLADHRYAPALLIAVDKNSQQLFTFEKHSPMTKVLEFPCTTGQSTGDKVSSGDLKTPEGIYFVVRHIAAGLDYVEYGNEAYTLNYPNPVDRLRNKTGYGIWIHGKGVPLSPLATRGCVALNNSDVSTLGSKDLIGRPVTLAASINQAPPTYTESSRTAEILAGKVRAWAKAWGSRSADMFDFYDPAAYSLAQGESFTAFRQQKESLFKRLGWIKTNVSNIQVLEGPGYWVTWFYQEYTAPNLTSNGVRRLYWQQDFKGEWRIVGMEWILSDRPAYMVAEADIPGHSISDASAPSVAAQPKQPETPPLVVAQVPTQKTQEQTAPAVANVDTAPKASGPETTAQDAAEATQSGPQRQATPNGKEHQNATEKDVLRFVEMWRTAWESGTIDVYAACYTADIVQDSRSGRDAVIDQKRDVWKRAAPVKVGFSNVRVKAKGQGSFEVTLRQYYENSQGYSDLGEKTLLLQAQNGSLFIAKEIWRKAER